MTKQEANEKLLTKESIYINKYGQIKTVYAAVIKNPLTTAITDDFIIEIGYENGEIDHDQKLRKLLNHSAINNILKKTDKEVEKDLENGNLQFRKVNPVNYQQNPIENIYKESKKKYHSLTGGISVFDEVKNNESGTAGAFFKIEGSEDIFLISNYHVLLGDSGCLGDKIVHPSKSHSRDWIIIGEIFWKKFKETNLIDAAIAKINYPVNIGRYTRCNHIKMLGLGNPVIGDNIRKCGRKTGLTYGEIRSDNCTVNAGGDNYEVYRNQILTTKISEDGDSGSALVNDNNQVIGLIFSGDNTNVSFANNINVIFELINKDYPNFIFKKFV